MTNTVVLIPLILMASQPHLAMDVGLVLMAHHVCEADPGLTPVGHGTCDGGDLGVVDKGECDVLSRCPLEVYSEVRHVVADAAHALR